MSNILGGNLGQAYRGTQANSPANVTFEKIDPTPYDAYGYSVGDFWVNEVLKKVWYLLSLQNPGAPTTTVKGNYATWIQLGSSSGNLEQLTTPAGVVLPTAGNISFTSTDDSISFVNTGSSINIQVAPVTPTTLPAFSAISTIAVTNATGDGTSYFYVNDTVIYDQGSPAGYGYDATTGVYTVFYPGIYDIKATGIPLNLSSGHTDGYVALSINGSGGAFGNLNNAYANVAVGGIGDGEQIYVVVADFKLNKGDTIQPVLYVDGGAKTVTANAGTIFTAHLVR